MLFFSIYLLTQFSAIQAMPQRLLWNKSLKIHKAAKNYNRFKDSETQRSLNAAIDCSTKNSVLPDDTGTEDVVTNKTSDAAEKPRDPIISLIILPDVNFWTDAPPSLKDHYESKSDQEYPKWKNQSLILRKDKTTAEFREHVVRWAYKMLKLLEDASISKDGQPYLKYWLQLNLKLIEEIRKIRTNHGDLIIKILKNKLQPKEYEELRVFFGQKINCWTNHNLQYFKNQSSNNSNPLAPPTFIYYCLVPRTGVPIRVATKSS